MRERETWRVVKKGGQLWVGDAPSLRVAKGGAGWVVWLEPVSEADEVGICIGNNASDEAAFEEAKKILEATLLDLEVARAIAVAGKLKAVSGG